MSEEFFAISKISPAPAAQSDYDSICAALMQTERGRWFLQEYTRRNRSFDTHILLASIARIEAVVCAQPSRPARQGFRSDLLDMVEAITRTRAEVAEIRSDGAAPAQSALPEGDASPAPPRSRDIFAAAERIRDVTWAMRGHGFDPSTCDQLEELAASILSASALRDPTDRRASKLSEVLQYLEHRIDILLESSAEGDAVSPEPGRAPRRARTGGGVRLGSAVASRV
jgi:chemotaxis protein CheZ